MNWNAELELQHIYLEVQAERFHHLRVFMEDYFCFQHGYVTEKGVCDWRKMLPDLPKSRMVIHNMDAKREWLIPCSVIIGLFKVLVRDEYANKENIQAILDCYVGFVLISEQEQQRLKQKGWQSAMPISFYQPKSSDFQCAFSRFSALKIAFPSITSSLSVTAYPKEV